VTTVKLQMSTRDRLKHIGRKDESFDDLLNRLMDEYIKQSYPEVVNVRK